MQYAFRPSSGKYSVQSKFSDVEIPLPNAEGISKSPKVIVEIPKMWSSVSNSSKQVNKKNRKSVSLKKVAGNVSNSELA